MKKTFLTLILATFCCLSANAAGVGVINYTYILDNYSVAKQHRKELDNKYKDLKKYVVQQENAVKKAATQQQKDTIQKRALIEVEAKQKDYITYKSQKEKEILAKINIAAEKVRKTKQFDIILKKEATVVGGTDCTKEVLSELSK